MKLELRKRIAEYGGGKRLVKDIAWTFGAMTIANTAMVSTNPKTRAGEGVILMRMDNAVHPASHSEDLYSRALAKVYDSNRLRVRCMNKALTFLNDEVVNRSAYVDTLGYTSLMPIGGNKIFLKSQICDGLQRFVQGANDIDAQYDVYLLAHEGAHGERGIHNEATATCEGVLHSIDTARALGRHTLPSDFISNIYDTITQQAPAEYIGDCLSASVNQADNQLNPGNPSNIGIQSTASKPVYGPFVPKS